MPRRSKRKDAPPETRGRPKRNPHAPPAEAKSVRIDALTEQIVLSRFATLGDALYYLAALSTSFQGSYEEVERTPFLATAEINYLRFLITERLKEFRGPGKFPGYRALKALEAMLPPDPSKDPAKTHAVPFQKSISPKVFPGGKTASAPAGPIGPCGPATPVSPLGPCGPAAPFCAYNA